ncbi:tRNA pseudouridine(38-40) synthase TruA [Paenibacillus sp. y28]|uniref:tRNA pseudouridine(38-40) synthase TruA n=1 Tax=Paenibacillus sp. y28 TaxID=3129110 RepID=UPI00301B6064
MRNIRMVISYDGTAYYGFQSQPSGNTIQDKLEEAIKALTGEQVKIISSGRTDAGVHARAQVVNFFTASPIPVKRWCVALNSRLPRDIVILDAIEISDDFHARKSAKRKTYRYTINCSQVPDVFLGHMHCYHPRRLDWEQMRSALTYLIGEHDFTSFCTVSSLKENNVRTVYSATLTFEPSNLGEYEKLSGLIHIDITGSGFLHNMVRIIVGTLIQIGEGRRNASDMQQILHARSRAAAGPTAIAQGLILWDVRY